MRPLIGLILFCMSLAVLAMAFICVFFAFNRGAQSVKGIFNVGCAAQSLIYPTAVLG